MGNSFCVQALGVDFREPVVPQPQEGDQSKLNSPFWIQLRNSFCSGWFIVG
jgi:hypothetical protein